MIIRRISFLVFLSIISLSVWAQDSIRLALVYPTVRNIQTFTYLLNSKMIDLPNVELIAVCYAHSDYDYNRTKKYVKDNNLKNISFIDVEGKISYDELYQKNACTKEFYSVFKQTDGIIFPGGDDLPAFTYGEESLFNNVNLNPKRHYFELSFLYHLYGGFQKSSLKPFLDERKDYAILGICLGAQTMSTAAGGTMIQDIPSEVYGMKNYDDVTKQNPQEIHRSPWYNIYSENDILSCSFHSIVMDKQMQKNFVKSPTVLSCHHQAIEKIGKDFYAWAWSPDKKVIEAIQHQNYPNVFAVQFHPEATILYVDKQYRMTPKGDLKNIPDILSDNDKKFHKEIWAYFSTKLENAVKINEN